MINYYFLIINKEDYYRYGLFLGGFLKSSNYKIWGQLKNTVKDLWNDIKENDVIIFGNDDFNFKSYAKVKKKSIVESNDAQSFFGTSYRAKELKYLLYFDDIYKTKFTYSEMKHFVGLDNDPSHGLFPIHKIAKELFLEKFKNNQQGKLDIFEIGKSTDSLKGKPKQTQRTVTVFERDSDLVKKLKNQYNDFCQICNYRIKKSNGGHYSEVHHFWPLQYGGDDNVKNMLVVCPNHHKEFDLCAIALLEDGISVIDSNKKVISTLKISQGHKIDQKNINFHLNRFERN